MSEQPPKLFISYAREDVEYKDQLVVHLEGLKQQGVISSWHDGLLVAGQQWDEEIVKHLDTSRIILLLISSDFIASDYITRVELNRAATRYARGEVTIIPIPTRNVYGWEKKPFGAHTLGKFQRVPGHPQFIVEWENRDAAFAEVVEGIEKAVKELKLLPESTVSHDSIPRPPSFGFVSRRDRDGRDIIERLREELAPQRNQLVALWGAGGVGKTTLAAEAARAITVESGQRAVWVTADGRPNFAFTTLLDDIAEQLGRTNLRPLAVEPKEEAVRALIATAATLIVLDDFETIPPEQESLCLDFLAQRAQCPALITTRQRVENALLIPLATMSADEASKFLDKLIAQTQDPGIYTESVRARIIQTAESNPLIVQWVVGQIDLAQAPEEVLSELSQGEGDAAERVFDRSFNLPQMAEGGRAVLLALSLFMPSATRTALAEVAGMDKHKDKKKFKRAQQTLASLWLLKQTSDGQRLAVAGLTRELAKARLSRDPRAKTFRPRFVSRFVRYAQTHEQPTAVNLNALEIEKDNVLGAIDVAHKIEDWESVSNTYFAIREFLDLRGYWEEAIKRGEQAVAAAHTNQDVTNTFVLSVNTSIVPLKRGEYEKCRQTWQEALAYFEKIGNKDLASSSLLNLGIIAHYQGDYIESTRLYNESLQISEKSGNEKRAAHGLNNLGILALEQSDYAEARRLHNESLMIKNKLGDQGDIASSLMNLGVLALEEENLDEAEEYLKQSISILRKLGDKSNIAYCLEGIGNLRVAQGRYQEAEAIFDESLELAEALFIPRTIGSLKHSRAMLAEKRGDKAGAMRLLREALEMLVRLDFYKAERTRKDLARLESEFS